MIAQHSTEKSDWMTPPLYTDAARRVLGAIDLDPASNGEANHTIQAARFYGPPADGLTLPWYGSVWLNPPYGRRDGESSQALWSERFLAAHCEREIRAGILLVNAHVGTRWFDRLLMQAHCCLARQRIRFIRPGGEPGSSPTHGNAFFYLGPDLERFAEVFSQFGPVYSANGATS